MGVFTNDSLSQGTLLLENISSLQNNIQGKQQEHDPDQWWHHYHIKSDIITRRKWFLTNQTVIKIRWHKTTMKSDWSSASDWGGASEPDHSGGAQFSESNASAGGSGVHVGNHQSCQSNSCQRCSQSGVKVCVCVVNDFFSFYTLCLIDLSFSLSLPAVLQSLLSTRWTSCPEGWRLTTCSAPCLPPSPLAWKRCNTHTHSWATLHSETHKHTLCWTLHTLCCTTTR